GRPGRLDPVRAGPRPPAGGAADRSERLRDGGGPAAGAARADLPPPGDGRRGRGSGGHRDGRGARRRPRGAPRRRGRPDAGRPPPHHRRTAPARRGGGRRRPGAQRPGPRRRLHRPQGPGAAVATGRNGGAAAPRSSRREGRLTAARRRPNAQCRGALIGLEGGGAAPAIGHTAPAPPARTPASEPGGRPKPPAGTDYGSPLAPPARQSVGELPRTPGSAGTTRWLRLRSPPSHPSPAPASPRPLPETSSARPPFPGGAAAP